MHIPKQHYVGIIGRQNDQYPLGFMTEYGTDAAAKKRMGTVDSWVSQNTRRDGAINDKATITNRPLSGFILTDGICERHRSGVRTKWRVEDPRGFELEISWSNLEYIMANTVIDKGEILSQCIWARSSGDNYLLVKGTQAYTDAVDSSTLLEKVAIAGNVKLSTLKIGNQVLFKNQDRGTFLGKSRNGELLFDKDDYLYSVKKPTVLALLSENEISVKEADERLTKIQRWGTVLTNTNVVKTEDIYDIVDLHAADYRLYRNSLVTKYNDSYYLVRQAYNNPTHVVLDNLRSRMSNNFMNSTRNAMTPIEIDKKDFTHRAITRKVKRTYESGAVDIRAESINYDDAYTVDWDRFVI